MNKFRQSALQILKKSKKPLHYKEITRLALEEGILETDGKTPEASMNAQLIMDVKNKGKASDFMKTAPATFSLNPNKNNIISKQAIEQDEKEDEKITVESGFTGKAGEHLVCSELLFLGFNASIMSVDVGLDIVATKDGKMFGIQVKTSNLNSFKTYIFDIRKASFERHESGNIYYIFVLHGDSKNNFLILPFHESEKLVQQNIIREVDHGKRYRVNIKFRKGKVYLGNLNNDMGYYLNNWKLIK
ncbi:MAG: hypothetical protein JW870_16810 [Candidatus Delongbacteria bacterium]|nr:hypothetical protein [Candidatus Delongbacteria bacterium]